MLKIKLEKIPELEGVGFKYDDTYGAYRRSYEVYGDVITTFIYVNSVQFDKGRIRCYSSNMFDVLFNDGRIKKLNKDLVEGDFIDGI